MDPHGGDPTRRPEQRLTGLPRSGSAPAAPTRPIPGGSAPRPPYRPERPRPQTPDGLKISPSGV
ncbi:hypothetical protein FE633_30400 [Streptomyces montanus]|uniref:Uncharacterized protein n=1 Tax=Streptomyces montanus TaxID=2580423 RepID=A0A5R9FIU9_9ACTN|nr:hypothetical protein FE633_30400 [Streptomyces montanus]